MPLRPAAAQDKRDVEAIEATVLLSASRPAKNQKPGRAYRYQVRQPSIANRTAQDGKGKSHAGQTPHIPKGAKKTTAQQFPVGPPPKDKTYITIGVTLWRVRLATEAESKDPKISKEQMTVDGQEREVVVTRISDDSPISDQDFIQMSIEYLPDPSGAGAEMESRAGYLYVINQEQFHDGNLKNARLIFPTKATYQGDNRLLPGRLVTLPDPDRPFRITRSNSGQAQEYESYTIILSPTRLDSELPQQLGKKAMELSPDLVAGWEKQWGTDEVRADLQDCVGRPRTLRELRANGDTSEVRGTEDTEEDLDQSDPPPQMVFRRVVKSGATMLVKVKLPFKGAAPKSGSR